MDVPCPHTSSKTTSDDQTRALRQPLMVWPGGKAVHGLRSGILGLRSGILGLRSGILMLRPGILGVFLLLPLFVSSSPYPPPFFPNDFEADALFPDTLLQDSLSQGGLSPDTLSADSLSQASLSQGGLSPDTLSPDTLSQASLSQGGLSQGGLSPDTLSPDGLISDALFPEPLSVASGDPVRRPHDPATPVNLRLSGKFDAFAATLHESFTETTTSAQKMNLQLTAALQLPGRWSAQATLQNFLYLGAWLEDYLGYGFLQFNRFDWLDMNRTWKESTSALAYSRLDRAHVDYTGERFALRAGRQLISWGQTLIWSPADIFNTHSLMELDRPLKQGSDALRLSFFPGPLSQLELAAKLNAYNELTAAAMGRFTFRRMDLQLQAGVADARDWMVGGGFATETGRLGIRSEWALYVPMRREENEKNTLLFVIGADGILKNQLALQGELMYNRLPHDVALVGPLTRLYRAASSPKALSHSRWSLSANASYPVNPRLRVLLMSAAFADDRMLLLAPSVRWKPGQNTELMLNVQWVTLEYRSQREEVRAAMLQLIHSF